MADAGNAVANGREMTDTFSSAAAASVVEFDFETEIFRLPERVRSDAHYVRLHAEFTRRLRHDAQGLTLTTLHMTLIERIVTGYVVIRWHEDNVGQWSGLNTEKDFRLEWRQLFAEFNKILASGEDKRRDALRISLQEIMLEGLSLIPATEDRKSVRTFYMSKFSELGE